MCVCWGKVERGEYVNISVLLRYDVLVASENCFLKAKYWYFNKEKDLQAFVLENTLAAVGR